jgi:hypothetical protein
MEVSFLCFCFLFYLLLWCPEKRGTRDLCYFPTLSPGICGNYPSPGQGTYPRVPGYWWFK